MREDRVVISKSASARKALRRSVAVAGLALLLAPALAGAAFAQSNPAVAPAAKPKPQPVQSEPGLPTLAHISASPVPTLDEGTAQRMAGC